MNKTPDICGRMSPTPFATYDPDTSCWRTCEATLFSDSPPYSATFPAWGMTRSGDAYERQMSERPTVASDCSSLLGTPNAHPRTHTPRDVRHGMQLANQVAALLPTPTSRDHKGRNQRNDTTCLPGAVALLPTPTARLGRENGGSAQAKRYTNPERSNDLDNAIAWAQQQMEVD